ncbi:MAG: calcium-binding protein, partial [Leptolyngbya sp. SIO1D8]|nr:calcium-binding protein [Leptolyngbya sp. SIO1D8]
RFEMATLYGTDKDDQISGGQGNDSIFGLGGNDTLWGWDGDDYLNGGDGDDSLFAWGNGDDYLYGGDGNDVISGAGNGKKTFVGGDGDDHLAMVGGYGTQKFYGGNGNDYILLDNNDGASSYISGGNGDDYILRRGDSNDTLSGGAGNDTLLIIDEGQLRGGLGNDTYVISFISSVTIIEYQNQGIDEVQSERTFVLDDHLENLTLLSEKSDIWHGAGDTLQTLNFNGYGNDLDNVVTGNIGANILLGNAGNDTLDGNAGNDRLIGGAGEDSLLGGSGNDTLIGTDDFNTVGAVDQGVGTIDIMTGAAGSDRFVLGQSGRVFYDDGFSGGFGSNDYALITDFEKTSDTIQLWGKASDYALGSAFPFGVLGIALYLRTPNIFSDDLVAIVQGGSNLNLNDSYFDYVTWPSA